MDVHGKDGKPVDVSAFIVDFESAPGQQVDPSARDAVYDPVFALSRLGRARLPSIDITGTWDHGAAPAGLFGTENPRELTITPRGFSIGRLHFYPSLMTTTATVKNITTTLGDDGLLGYGATLGAATPITTRRAERWRWLLFWIGWPVVCTWRRLRSLF